MGRAGWKVPWRKRAYEHRSPWSKRGWTLLTCLKRGQYHLIIGVMVYQLYNGYHSMSPELWLVFIVLHFDYVVQELSVWDTRWFCWLKQALDLPFINQLLATSFPTWNSSLAQVWWTWWAWWWTRGAAAAAGTKAAKAVTKAGSTEMSKFSSVWSSCLCLLQSFLGSPRPFGSQTCWLWWCILKS